MYTKTAKFYDALYHFKDYAAEAEKLQAFIEQLNPNAKTLLDVACGTGKHLEYLQNIFQVEGLELSADLLNVARERCPEVSFHLGNMMDFNLGRHFDVITCLFSSISYVKTIENVEQAIRCMAQHLKPEGILVIEPWISPEKYWRNKIVANFVEEPELKIAWMYKHETEGSVSVSNIHYLVGTPQGVEHFTERHEMGLFKQEQYVQAFEKAGLAVDYDPEGLFGRGMYIARFKFMFGAGSL
ncbi:MAG: class I SAM-dependent methyltransferase [Lewinellaceae bacterium]|nr:class I SAM-dependent methyltransferase [Lewinellaceae bacterium]